MTDTVVTTAIDGYPQRVVRTEVVDELERASIATRLPRALRRALEFRKLTGTSYQDLLARGPGHEAQPGPDAGASWPWPPTPRC